MKIYWLVLIYLSISHLSCNQQKPVVQLVDINGVWVDSSSSATQNAVMVLSERDGKVVMVHYLEWKNKKFVEFGIGKREQNTISYTAMVTKPIEGWADEGFHLLSISPDGQTLRGSYEDNTNSSGPLVFKKQR